MRHTRVPSVTRACSTADVISFPLPLRSLSVQLDLSVSFLGFFCIASGDAAIFSRYISGCVSVFDPVDMKCLTYSHTIRYLLIIKSYKNFLKLGIRKTLEQ